MAGNRTRHARYWQTKPATTMPHKIRISFPCIESILGWATAKHTGRLYSGTTMTDDLTKKEGVGVALGGGAVYGAAHVGVLRALEEAGISIDYIAGTSIGAFIAAMYACGKSLDEIEETLIELDWLDISRFKLSRLGLLSNDKLGEQFEKSTDIREFDDTRIPLGVVATDISSGDRVALTDGDIAQAVRASTCVPGVFIPVERNDRLLVDGGLVDNVPVSLVRELGANYAIGVDLSRSRSYQKPADLVDVLVNSIDIAIDNATRLQTSDVDLLITPKLSSGSRTDTGRVAELAEDGYSSTCKQLADSSD